MTSVDPNFDHLDRAGRLTAGLSRSPRGAVYLALAIAVALSWLLLAALAVRAARTPAGGPGEVLLSQLPAPPLPRLLEELLALCLTPVGFGAGGVWVLLSLLLMWFLMSLAMMLPSAAPMIRTYCEIADTAARKGEPVIHPLVLVSGYLAAWLAASLAFALLTLLVQEVAATDNTKGLLAASAALAIAGLYQFSRLKEACLKKCRNPFAILFSRWSTRRGAIFQLGVQQGIWCIGCCWALMLVMFAVGVMNVFWMALIGLFTIVEKQLSGRLVTRIAGAILLVWSVALLVLSAASG